MAGKFFTYNVTHQTVTSIKTICQFLVAAQCRALLHQIRVMPLGSTGASSPLYWIFGKNDDAGTAGDDSSALMKMPPTYTQNIQTTVQSVFTVEPTKTAAGPQYYLSSHQQNNIAWAMFRPETPLVMEAAERWGLWYPASQAGSIDVEYSFILEE